MFRGVDLTVRYSMKRFLTFAAAAALIIVTIYALRAVDSNTKRIAGFLDTNVFFDIEHEDDATVVTIFNEKIKLR